jgi:rubrerythrin
MPNADQRVLDMLCTAMEMAERGQDLYEKALAACENSLGKEIFAMLRDEEGEHASKIRETYDSLKMGKDWAEAWSYCRLDPKRTKTVFDKVAEKYGPTKACLDELQALNMALELEDSCIKFYKAGLDKAADALEKDFCEAMLAEERGHRKILSDMQFFYEDPAAWFTEKEHPHIDGA